MNERIKELSKQAFEYTLDRLNSGLEFRDFQPVWTEKFAELIVKECIEVIDMTHGSKKLMRPDPYQKIIWAIEEHFGVEE